MVFYLWEMEIIFFLIIWWSDSKSKHVCKFSFFHGIVIGKQLNETARTENWMQEHGYGVRVNVFQINCLRYYPVEQSNTRLSDCDHEPPDS